MNEVAPIGVFAGLDRQRAVSRSCAQALAPEVAALCKRERGAWRAHRDGRVVSRRLGGRTRDRSQCGSRRAAAGLACAGLLSALEDELIGAIYDYVVRYVYVVDNPTFAERLAIVAVGGYGRGTLAPGSDIDLLFLFPYKQTPWGESVVEAILYMLWDLRQKVGHATRTVEECLRQARADMTIRTTLLEARFILGNAELFSEFRESFEREIAEDTRRIRRGQARRTRCAHRAGRRSRYLVEPNVKDGKGGLRDLNTLFWIAKYVYRVREANDLVAAGLFSAAEFRLFCRCEEFLWRVRCHLHFLTGRAEERLSFDSQRRSPSGSAISTAADCRRVERFMKHYFLVAKDVGDLTAIVCAALEEKQAKPAPFSSASCAVPAPPQPRPARRFRRR